MKAQVILRWTLLAIVFGSIGVYAYQKSRGEATPPSVEAAALDTAATAKADVVVTYFTTDVRCESCQTIEALSRSAVEEGFPTEVASGAVLFRVINTDRAENEHYIDEYEITNKTVIVSQQEKGAETGWTDRQDVWVLLDEPAAFADYVREPIAQYLGNG